MNIQDLEKTECIMLKCLSGSRAYGLATADSDTDYRGVFMQSQDQLYGLEECLHVNNPSHDISYYETKKFMLLLSKSNPSVLELLFTPEDCIQIRHPAMNLIKPSDFLSRQCEQTFAGYAMAQIKKAKGLNKKINQPQELKRKTVLDCCFITEFGKTRPLKGWLKVNGLQQADCALVSLPHMPHLFALYHAENMNFKGIVAQEDISNEVSLSSVPKGLTPLTYLYFNQDLYEKYCRDYKSYWVWVTQRNKSRYQNTLDHGKKYDAKNMMHTHRLLDMARDIAKENTIHVKRPNREFLLQIKRGELEYDDLLKMALEKIASLKDVFLNSDLPNTPDPDLANQTLVELRQAFYGV